MTQSKKEAVERIKYLLKTQGRTGTLYPLIGNLKQFRDDDDEHKLLLFVELSECQHFLEIAVNVTRGDITGKRACLFRRFLR